MIKYWLTCIYLFAVYSTNAQIEYAESVYASGNYELAGVEYERLIFLNSDYNLRNQAILGKVESLKQLGKFNEAYSTSLRGNTYTQDSSTNDRLRYESVLCAYLAERYNDSYNQFKQLEYFSTNNQLVDASRVVAALSLNELGRWNEAKDIMASLKVKYDLGIDVNKLYHPRDYPKIRDVKKQQFSLALFPSFVMVREGEVTSGFASMLLKAFVLSYNVYHLLNGYYLNALVAGGTYALLYMGSTSQAGDALIINNNRKLQNYNSNLRNQILQSIEKNNKQLSLNPF